jgi:hypothetical protein
MAPLPWLDGMKYTEYVSGYETEVQYEINDILLFFSFSRLYLTFKFVLY